MSLFRFNYGRTMSFSAVLDDTSATTLLSVTDADPELTVLHFQAALPSGASDTTVRFDKYDGSTAFPLITWVMTQADGVCFEESPIHLGKGWSLRATRTAGGNVAITGLYIHPVRTG